MKVISEDVYRSEVLNPRFIFFNSIVSIAGKCSLGKTPACRPAPSWPDLLWVRLALMLFDMTEQKNEDEQHKILPHQQQKKESSLWMFANYFSFCSVFSSSHPSASQSM